jgi:hypothetical protein
MSSLWQGTRWSHRQPPSGLNVHASRPSVSGTSSAAASTSSLLSVGSGPPTPRRPLNAFNLQQERRSDSLPRARPPDGFGVKIDHDPVKTLAGILGEVPRTETSIPSQKMEYGKRADAGGRTLYAWLEELEKDKPADLTRVIRERIASRLMCLIIEQKDLDLYQELQTSIDV